MATKAELIEVAEALGIETEGVTKRDLETTINNTKKALESIKTTEEIPISRITRNAWWCPHCGFAMPNAGISINAEGQNIFLKGSSNPINTCTNCRAERKEIDGKDFAVATR